MARGKYIVIFHAIESSWCCGIKYSNLGQAKKRLNNWISNLGNKPEHCFGIIGEEAFDYKRRIDSDIMYRFKESEPSPADLREGAIRRYEWFDFPTDECGLRQFSTDDMFPSVERVAKVFHLSEEDMREKLVDEDTTYETKYDGFCLGNWDEEE